MTSSLPAHKYKDEILSMIDNNRISIVTGETGSGKSTQIPQFILEHHRNKNGSHPRIICTQPRRISAISLARYVAQCRGLPPSNNTIAHQIGGDRERVHPKHTKLTYATTGVLKEQILHVLGKYEKWAQQNSTSGDPSQSNADIASLRYDYVIMDEVHERSIDVDVVLLLMKRILSIDPNIKLILMSATINAKDFAQYFDELVPQQPEQFGSGHVPTTNIPVRCFEVEEYYLEDIFKMLKLPSRVLQVNEPSSKRNVLELGVKLIRHIDQYEDRTKSILIFLPGYSSIVEMTNMLEELGYYVIMAHSTIPTEEQQLMFEPAPEGQRKVVVSTNIAESSITVPDVSTVIDFCLEKQLQLNPITNCQSLNEVFSAKENCEQRKGRAGRCGPGKCYRILTRKQYEALSDHTIPEIQRTHISRLVLQILRMDIGAPEDILMGCLNPPDEDLISASYSELFSFEGIRVKEAQHPEEEDTIEITDLGCVLSDLPLDVRVGMFLLNCMALGLDYEAVVVASIISIDTSPIFHHPAKPVDNIRNRFNYLGGTNSDVLASYIAYETFREKLYREADQTPESIKFMPHYLQKSRAVQLRINLKKYREIHSQVLIIYSRLSRFRIRMPDQWEFLKLYESRSTVHPIALRMLTLNICATFMDNALVAKMTDSFKTNPAVKLKGFKKNHSYKLRDFLQAWLGRKLVISTKKKGKEVSFPNETAGIPEKLNSAVEMTRINNQALEKIRITNEQRERDVRFTNIYSFAHYLPSHSTQSLFRRKYKMSVVGTSVCSPVQFRDPKTTPFNWVVFVPTQVRGKNNEPTLFASQVTRLPEEPGLLDLLFLLFSRHIHFAQTGLDGEDDLGLPVLGVRYHEHTHYFKAAITDDLLVLINLVRSHLQTFSGVFSQKKHNHHANQKVRNSFFKLCELYSRQYEETRERLLKAGDSVDDYPFSKEEIQKYHRNARQIHDVFVEENGKKIPADYQPILDLLDQKVYPCKELLASFLSGDEIELELPTSLSKGDRKSLHILCQKHPQLDTKSIGKQGKDRRLIVMKLGVGFAYTPLKETVDSVEMNLKRRIAKAQKRRETEEQWPSDEMEDEEFKDLDSDLVDLDQHESIIDKFSLPTPFDFDNIEYPSDSWISEGGISLMFTHITAEEQNFECGNVETCGNLLASSVWKEYHHLSSHDVVSICIIHSNRTGHTDDIKEYFQSIIQRLDSGFSFSYFADDQDIRLVEEKALDLYMSRSDPDLSDADRQKCVKKLVSNPHIPSFRFIIPSKREYSWENFKSEYIRSICYNVALPSEDFSPILERCRETLALDQLVCRSLLLSPKRTVDMAINLHTILSYFDSLFDGIFEMTPPPSPSVVDLTSRKGIGMREHLKKKFEEYMMSYHNHFRKGTDNAIQHALAVCYKALEFVHGELESLQTDLNLLLHLTYHLCAMCSPFFPPLKRMWETMFPIQLSLEADYSEAQKRWSFLSLDQLGPHVEFYNDYSKRLYDLIPE